MDKWKRALRKTPQPQPEIEPLEEIKTYKPLTLAEVQKFKFTKPDFDFNTDKWSGLDDCIEQY